MFTNDERLLIVLSIFSIYLFIQKYIKIEPFIYNKLYKKINSINKNLYIKSKSEKTFIMVKKFWIFYYITNEEVYPYSIDKFVLLSNIEPKN